MEIYFQDVNTQMGFTGNAILRSIQNNYMSNLDLLVRESIQNSTDAFDKQLQRESVNMFFDVDEFDTYSFNKQLGCIGEYLNSKSTTLTNKYLAISDLYTTGLEGPLKSDDPSKIGKFSKLVYHVAKNNKIDDAGGSWGYGKTVYYRLGIGLVIYYTRYKENNVFKSRLAGCLIENENNYNSILNNATKKKQAGIAWFGKTNEQFSPVEDESTIKEILSTFDIDPYENNQTGTIVIIPYFDEKKVLKDLLARTDFEDHVHYAWKNDFEQTLVNQIMKWYAPRIDNKTYYECLNKPYLNIRVNGKKITINEDYPIYNIERELYNVALSSNYRKEYNSKYYNNILKEKFNYKNLTPDFIGTFAYRKFTKKELHGLGNTLPSPYVYLDKGEIAENSNSPIISYTRSPGMTVDYAINDDKWCRLDSTPKNEYLIGIFVLNSQAIFSSNHDKLEAYIRNGEVADHNGWSDTLLNEKKYRIISRCQSYIRSTINETYKKKEEIKTKEITGMGQRLGQLFFPAHGIGNANTLEPSNKTKKLTSKDKTTSKKNIKNKIVINDIIDFTNDYILLDFEINFGKKYDLIIETSILTGNNKIFANQSNHEGWEDTQGFDKPFPVEIVEINFETITNNTTKKQILDNPINFKFKDNTMTVFRDIQIESLKSDHYGIYNGFMLSKDFIDDFFTIKGTIKLKVSDHNLVYKLSVKGGVN